MAQSDYDRLTDALLDLLETERNALLCGDLMSLEDLALRKAELCSELAALDVAADVPKRSHLLARARANESLLGAAESGVRAVIDRLAELRRITEGGGTYDRDGRPAQLTEAPSRHERRA